MLFHDCNIMLRAQVLDLLDVSTVGGHKTVSSPAVAAGDDWWVDMMVKIRKWFDMMVWN